MKFEKVTFIRAFYDKFYDEVFYQFRTIPMIDHGEWAISEAGDSAYNLVTDELEQAGFPIMLHDLLDYVPENIYIEGLPS